MLRLALERRQAATQPGWLSLLGDPALTLMHENRGYPWGQEELASAAAMPHGTFARVPAHHRHHARRYRRTRLGMHKRRSGTYKPEWGYRSVKPSAQPTLVRTQHLPPPAKTAR